MVSEKVKLKPLGHKIPGHFVDDFVAKCLETHCSRQDGTEVAVRIWSSLTLVQRASLQERLACGNSITFQDVVTKSGPSDIAKANKIIDAAENGDSSKYL